MPVKNIIVIITPYGAKENLERFPEFLLSQDLARDHQVYFLTGPETSQKNYNTNTFTVSRHHHRLCLSFSLMAQLFKLRKNIKAVFINHLRSDLNFSVCWLKKLNFITAPVFFIPQGIFHDDFLFDDRQNPLKESPQLDHLALKFCDFLKNPNIKSWRNWAWHAPLLICDAVICISQFEQDFFKKYFPLIKTHLIYNGVPALAPIVTKAFDSNRPLKILFMGQMKLRKGFDTYFKIVNELLDATQFFFRLITPSLKIPEPWKSSMQSFEKKGHFQCHQNVSNAELKDIMTDTDIMIIPSRYEGFGLPAIEAMQLGKIVIASNVPALNEIIISGYDGFLIDDYENPAAWIEAIQNIMAQKEQWPKFSIAAQQKSKKFSVETMTENYRNLLTHESL